MTINGSGVRAPPTARHTSGTALTTAARRRPTSAGAIITLEPSPDQIPDGVAATKPSPLHAFAVRTETCDRTPETGPFSFPQGTPMRTPPIRALPRATSTCLTSTQTPLPPSETVATQVDTRPGLLQTARAAATPLGREPYIVGLRLLPGRPPRGLGPTQAPPMPQEGASPVATLALPRTAATTHVRPVTCTPSALSEDTMAMPTMTTPTRTAAPQSTTMPAAGTGPPVSSSLPLSAFSPGCPGEPLAESARPNQSGEPERGLGKN